MYIYIHYRIRDHLLRRELMDHGIVRPAAQPPHKGTLRSRSSSFTQLVGKSRATWRFPWPWGYPIKWMVYVREHPIKNY